MQHLFTSKPYLCKPHTINQFSLAFWGGLRLWAGDSDDASSTAIIVLPVLLAGLALCNAAACFIFMKKRNKKSETHVPRDATPPIVGEAAPPFFGAYPNASASDAVATELEAARSVVSCV